MRHLHTALNVEDRVAALIRKQKLLHYPEGTSIAGMSRPTVCHAYANHMPGVLREHSFDQKRKNADQWIRNIHFFDDMQQHYLILCCTEAQAKEFQRAQFLQMDMSFKMVQGKTNVFSISGWNPETHRMSYICIGYVAAS